MSNLLNRDVLRHGDCSCNMPIQLGDGQTWWLPWFHDLTEDIYEALQFYIDSDCSTGDVSDESYEASFVVGRALLQRNYALDDHQVREVLPMHPRAVRETADWIDAQAGREPRSVHCWNVITAWMILWTDWRKREEAAGCQPALK